MDLRASPAGHKSSAERIGNRSVSPLADATEQTIEWRTQATGDVHPDEVSRLRHDHDGCGGADEVD